MTELKLGAALMVSDLPTHRNWLIDGQRDLEIQDFIFAENLGDAAPDLIATAKSQLIGYSGRLGIHGPFYDLPLDCRDPEVRGIVQKRLDQGLDAAAALGATQMVMHSPYTTWSAFNLDAEEGARAEKLKRTHDTLIPAVARAGALGVELVIENIEDKNPLDRITLADSFGVDHVRASLDTGHAHYAHDATGAPPVDYYVRAAGAKLAHVHIQDADGFADRHWAPGRGTVNWHAVFAALVESAPTARLVLELKNSAEVMPGFEYLRDLGVAT